MTPQMQKTVFKELGSYCIVGIDGPKYLDDGGGDTVGESLGSRARGGIFGDVLSVVRVRVFMSGSEPYGKMKQNIPILTN